MGTLLKGKSLQRARNLMSRYISDVKLKQASNNRKLKFQIKSVQRAQNHMFRYTSDARLRQPRKKTNLSL